MIEKSLEVGADSSQFPENWIFHSREKKPGKAFVDGVIIFFFSGSYGAFMFSINIEGCICSLQGRKLTSLQSVVG